MNTQQLIVLQRTFSSRRFTGTHAAREESEVVELAAAFFEMRFSSLLIAFLRALQNGGDTFQMAEPIFRLER